MLRALIRNWQLNSIAVLSLAVAMALTVVSMSVSNTLMLRSPVARDPGQLVTIYAVDKAHGGHPGDLSFPEFEYFHDHSQSFSGVAAFNYGFSKSTISYRGRDELAMENTVSDNYFEVMGIHPFLGRFFAAGDDRKRKASVVLTYACWKRWGADPSIVGQTVQVGETPLPIIGVAPKPFIAPVFAIGADLILNIGHDEARTFEDRNTLRFLLIARLKPATMRPQARSEIQSLWGQIASAYPEPAKNRAPMMAGMSVLPPDSINTGRVISAVLVACALLILLIACANTANLLLALATLRRQEALIKTALGAPRARLIGEFLRETVVLCGAGGAFGYVIAMLALRWLSRFDLTVPPFGTFPIAADLHPGALVVLCTVILVVAASIVSGLAPALYASKPNLASALSGEIALGGTRRSWIRNTVVAVQVAICTLALVGTGLCLQSVRRLRAVDPGFSARNIAAAFIFLETSQTRDEAGRLFRDLRTNAAAIPGVESVALASDLPLGGDDSDNIEVRFPDRPQNAEKIRVGLSTVDENYFATMGIRILQGRVFRPTARRKGSEEVIINHYMAGRFWPRQDPIGREFQIVEGKRTAIVVGVAADGKYANFDESPQAYFYRQLNGDYHNSVMLIARTSRDPRAWFDPLSRAVRQLGIKLPLPPMSLEEWFNLTLFFPRLSLFCVSGLTVLAMLLATAGLYGAISYSVRERRRELGIRIALGARPSQVLRLVFRRTMTIAGTGVALGLALGSVAGTLFQSQLYQIQPVEWSVMAPVAATMAAISLGIAYAGARRWTHMNPMEALRHV